MYSFGSVPVRRDPVIDSIIDSRKFSIIENPYTRLAQVTSQQAPRLSQRTNPSEGRQSIAEISDEVKERILTSQNGPRMPVSKTSELDKEGWDDGLANEPEKGKIESIEKEIFFN